MKPPRLPMPNFLETVYLASTISSRPRSESPLIALISLAPVKGTSANIQASSTMNNTSSNSNSAASSGPSLPICGPREAWLEHQLAVCQHQLVQSQARSQSLEAETHRLRYEKAHQITENQLLRNQVAQKNETLSSLPIHPAPQTGQGVQNDVVASLQDDLQRAKISHRVLSRQLDEANQAAKNAKHTLEQEKMAFKEDWEHFRRMEAEQNSEIVKLKAELETKKLEMEQVRQELQQKSDVATVLQAKVDELRIAKEDFEKALSCTFAELDFEREAHSVAEETLEDVRNDLEQERQEHDRKETEHEAAKVDLAIEKSRHEFAKIVIRENQEKLGIARYVWEFAAKIRLRWLLSHPISRGSKGNIISEGNRAAHDANLVVDLALMSLCETKDKYKQWLQSIYGIRLDDYICDYSKLKELKAKSVSTELINLKASISDQAKSPGALRFQELLGEIEEIREKIKQRHESEEDIEKAFENNESVAWIMQEMRRIVSNRGRD